MNESYFGKTACIWEIQLAICEAVGVLAPGSGSFCEYTIAYTGLPGSVKK